MRLAAFHEHWVDPFKIGNQNHAGITKIKRTFLYLIITINRAIVGAHHRVLDHSNNKIKAQVSKSYLKSAVPNLNV